MKRTYKGQPVSQVRLIKRSRANQMLGGADLELEDGAIISEPDVTRLRLNSKDLAYIELFDRPAQYDSISKVKEHKDVEQMIQDARLTALRITPEHITNCIANTEFYVFPGSCLTVCCMTLTNGYTTVGYSACASPENFNKEIGERIAKDRAKDQIGHLEGYLLKQALYQEDK